MVPTLRDSSQGFKTPGKGVTAYVVGIAKELEAANKFL